MSWLIEALAAEEGGHEPILLTDEITTNFNAKLHLVDHADRACLLEYARQIVGDYVGGFTLTTVLAEIEQFAIHVFTGSDPISTELGIAASRALALCASRYRCEPRSLPAARHALFGLRQTGRSKDYKAVEANRRLALIWRDVTGWRPAFSENVVHGDTAARGPFSRYVQASWGLLSCGTRADPRASRHQVRAAAEWFANYEDIIARVIGGDCLDQSSG